MLVLYTIPCFVSIHACNSCSARGVPTAGVSCGGWERGLAVETEKTQSQINAKKTRRVPTVSCTHEDGMPSFYTRERRSIQNMVTNFSFYPSKAQFKPVFDLRSENSGMMGGRHHFIPKKLWRKYNAVSMNGDSPNESNGDDRCVRSPAENSGMRPYDLNTGGVRIVTFPSIIQDRFV